MRTGVLDTDLPVGDDLDQQGRSLVPVSPVAAEVIPASERSTRRGLPGSPRAVRSRLAEGYRPATVNKMLAAVRGALKEAWRLDLIQADDYHRAVDLRGVSSHMLPRGRALTAGEIRALFAACATDRSPAGARDAAMLALLYGACGGRRWSRQEVRASTSRTSTSRPAP